MVVLLGLAFTLGKVGVVVLFWFVSFLALREFVSLTYTRRGDHWALAAVFFFFPAGAVRAGRARMVRPLGGVHPGVCVPHAAIFAAMSADTTRFFERTAKLYSALMICVYCISCVPALMTLRIAGFEGGNLLLIAWLVLTVQSSTCCSTVGRALRQDGPCAGAVVDQDRRGRGRPASSARRSSAAALAWLTPFSLVQAAGMALVVTCWGSSAAW